MGKQVKKKSRSFSLDEEEFSEAKRLAAEGGFSDRNEWLLALMEAASFLNLRPILDGQNRKVLRPSYPEASESRPMAAEDAPQPEFAKKAMTSLTAKSHTRAPVKANRGDPR